MAELLTIEVVCGSAAHQQLVRFQVPAGTTVRQAVLVCALEDAASLDVANAPLGIFGKQVSAPDQQQVAEGDRIEIYRPLLADPKEIRRLRAAKAAQKAKSE